MHRFVAILACACGLVVGTPAPALQSGGDAAAGGALGSSGQFIVGTSPASRWTLDLTPGDLRVWIDPTSQKSYWYFTYKVVNRTGQDRMFAPRVELLTDDGKILRSGRDVPIAVLRDIQRVLGNRLIEDQNEIIGDVLVGPENAKEGLVIWTAPNANVKELTMFFTGLSGETTQVPHPETGEPVTLAKTLARQYRTEGTAILRPSEPLESVREDWVWR